MKKVVFICTGNTCRSAMAEYLFRSKTIGKDVQVASMGLIGNYSPASKYPQELCKDIGISQHTSRPILYDELFNSDTIYVMENWQKDELVSAYPDLKSKTFLLLHKGIDISDPHGGTRDDYLHTYIIINKEIDAIVKSL